MIAPLMIAVFADGLRSVPRGWLEGSLGLGINRWRTFWKIGVRTARPALVAGTVLATARALGEAVMLAMVSGGVGVRAEPGRRADLLRRADAAAGGDDPADGGGADRRRRCGTRSSRWRRSCSSQRDDAVARRLGGRSSR